MPQSCAKGPQGDYGLKPKESSVRVQIVPHIIQLPEWFLKPLGYKVIAIAQVDFVVVVGLGFLIYNSCIFLSSSNMFSRSESSEGNNVLAEALGNCWLKFCCQHDERFRIISWTGRSAHLWIWSKLPMCIYCAYLSMTHIRTTYKTNNSITADKKNTAHSLWWLLYTQTHNSKSHENKSCFVFDTNFVKNKLMEGNGKLESILYQYKSEISLRATYGISFLGNILKKPSFSEGRWFELQTSFT